MQNGILITNGYDPIKSYWSLIIFASILLSIMDFKRKKQAKKTILLVACFTLSIIIYAKMIGFLFKMYYSQNELISPLGVFLLIIMVPSVTILSLKTVFIYFELRFQSNVIKCTITFLLTVLFCIMLPISVNYDLHWKNQFYKDYIYNILDDAIDNGITKCELIKKMYFYYDSNKTTLAEYRFNDSPFYHKKIAYEMCQATTNAITKREYSTCFSNNAKQTIESIGELLNSIEEERKRQIIIEERVFKNVEIEATNECFNIYIQNYPDQEKQIQNYVHDIFNNNGIE